MTKRNLAKERISLAIVIIVILSVAAALAVWWLQTEEPLVETINANNLESIGFSHTGNLVKNNPGMERGMWYLLYENPGQAALTAKLVFSGGSLCTIAGKESVCNVSKLGVGNRVTVDGRLSNGTVQVQKLIVK
ncbi:MAG: hypothetical protein V1845_00135 [bacterium]